MIGKDSLCSDIGKGLLWIRKSFLLTQFQLAAIAHLDYRHYQNIETGRVVVKVETLQRICLAIGMDLSTFFAIIDQKPWLRDVSPKAKGAGELFIFRLQHEHCRFPISDEVKAFLRTWGRELAEGNHSDLQQSSNPCLEIDRNGRLVWVNSSFQRELEGGAQDVVAAHLIPQIAEHLQGFWKEDRSSMYHEKFLALGKERKAKPFALVGLKPVLQKEGNSLFIALVDLTGDLERKSSLSVSRGVLCPCCAQLIPADEASR